MPLTIHMDHKSFPNPEIFNPENFTPERIAQRHNYSYLPFSLGPRTCLANHWILPVGCSALIMALTIHMDPKAFPNPEIFNSENFTPERIAQRHYYSYLPFSLGPRTCLGRTFAMLAMKTSLVHLIQNYRFFTVMKRDDIKLKSDIVLRCMNGFPVKIIPRQ